MINNLNAKPKVGRPRRVWIWATISVLVLILFGLVYWYQPITQLSIPNSDYWNDKVEDTITLAASMAAALLSRRLTRHFAPSEPPYRIWLSFTLAFSAWMGGELMGFVDDFLYWNTGYPDFTPTDVFWLVGYFFFGLSLYYQFRLIYSYKRKPNITLYLFVMALGLLLTLGLTQLALKAGLGEDISWGVLYAAVLYPVFDLVEGAAALWLFFLFGRGYLGKPWWGLILFAIADAINIFFWMGGYDWVSDLLYNQLDLVSTVAYLGGYMITALALIAAHEHLQRGITHDAPKADSTA